MLQWSRRPGFSKGTPWQARERETTTGGGYAHSGVQMRGSVRAPGQGVRGAKPLNLVFASRTTIICVCVIYNWEQSERKIVLPIDFSCFLCHLREFPRRGDGRIAPGILNPAVYTNSVYLLMLSKWIMELSLLRTFAPRSESTMVWNFRSRERKFQEFRSRHSFMDMYAQVYGVAWTCVPVLMFALQRPYVVV